MDISPIQRLAIAASHATPAAVEIRRPPAVAPTPQATPPSADQQVAHRDAATHPRTHVVVSWHAASLGYVTRVVDQHTGGVVLQTPPENVLEMVRRVIARLEGVSK